MKKGHIETTHHRQSNPLIKQINPDELAIVNICLVSSGINSLWIMNKKMLILAELDCQDYIQYSGLTPRPSLLQAEF